MHTHCNFKVEPLPSGKYRLTCTNPGCSYPPTDTIFPRLGRECKPAHVPGTANPGWGDWIEKRILRSRLRPLLVYLHIVQPGRCPRCDWRKQVLNRFGEGFMRRLRRLWAWLLLTIRRTARRG